MYKANKGKLNFKEFNSDVVTKRGRKAVLVILSI